MNNVCIIGNLTKDRESRATTSGKSVVKFSIAVNESKDNVHFFDVVSFNAENIVDWLVKGRKVGITGRLNQSRWQTQTGENRSKVEIVAHRIDFLDKRESGEQKPATPTVDPSIYDEDIPF